MRACAVTYVDTLECLDCAQIKNKYTIRERVSVCVCWRAAGGCGERSTPRRIVDSGARGGDAADIGGALCVVVVVESSRVCVCACVSVCLLRRRRPVATGQTHYTDYWYIKRRVVDGRTRRKVIHLYIKYSRDCLVLYLIHNSYTPHIIALPQFGLMRWSISQTPTHAHTCAAATK